MRRFFEAAGLALFSVTLMSCATMSVSSHVQRGIDFTRYRTYDLGPADALPTGDPRLDRDPFFRDHMEGAVIRQLTMKGFERPTSGSPDLLVHYHASITRRIDVDRTDREYGYCFDENCEIRTVEFEAGTLVLDIVDTHTNRVIWRGWAQRAVGDMLDNRDTMARRIDEAVARMLKRLPVGRIDVLPSRVGTGER